MAPSNGPARLAGWPRPSNGLARPVAVCLPAPRAAYARPVREGCTAALRAQPPGWRMRAIPTSGLHDWLVHVVLAPGRKAQPT
ncbi:hypothetical protein Slala03_14150 [Streptomyces lavendulae subsp. lavendulae]|nr:hypothetical protein Slala03_14150 [Streptomyces lavendulae subsp. lavendulae]